jgi:hypothetical protein
VSVCTRCASRIDRKLFSSFEESTVKLRRPRDWTLRVLREWIPWASIWWRQVSLDLSLFYTFFNHLPHYTFIPKDWLAFVIHVLVYLSGLDYYCLALCYCSTLINEHDENYQWYNVFPSFIMMLYLWPSRGLERFLECLSVRTCSLDDRPGKQCNHEGGMGCP